VKRALVSSCLVGCLALIPVSCSTPDPNPPARFSGDPGLGAPTTSAVPTVAAEKTPDPTPLDAASDAVLASTVATDPVCDPLDTSSCLLPFPSDAFTRADPATPSGRRVDLPTGQLANTGGTTLDPTEWNRNDGFSPGTPILAVFPGVDPVASKLPGIGDIGASLEGDGRPVHSVLWDLDRSEAVPHWVELDSAPSATSDPARRALIMRPAVALSESHHYVAAYLDLVDGSGATIAPSPAFVTYRDNKTTTVPAIEARRASMERLFTALGAAGVPRSHLTLAWDFTVASRTSLSGRMLEMRDDAFARLGDAAPTFTIDQVITADLPDGIGRRVRGTFEVPSYLEGSGAAGARLHYDRFGNLPAYAGYDWHANFTCQIPAKALAGSGGTTRPVVYGHGLLGAADEAENGQVANIASTNDMLYCATDWIGMSEGDVGNAAQILGDISKFPSMPDRTQQGMLDSLFLARVMIRPDGFGADPAFRNDAGSSIIDTTTAYYDGNSQGGIIGGAVTAIAQDWTRAVLGVPGMDYSTLLSRSVDFESYFAILRSAYPDQLDQQVIYGVLQMLWDRAEADGYAQHMTDHPYPGTPAHVVLLHAAFGDHQVANVAAEVEARTIGAELRTPALAPGRSTDTRPFFGLDPIESYPHAGSALIYFDSGTLAAPAGNITPASSAEYHASCDVVADPETSVPCHDPHEDPRRATASISQKDAFFGPSGALTDTCDGKPCTAVPRFRLDD